MIMIDIWRGCIMFPQRTSIGSSSQLLNTNPPPPPSSQQQLLLIEESLSGGLHRAQGISDPGYHIIDPIFICTIIKQHQILSFMNQSKGYQWTVISQLDHLPPVFFCWQSCFARMGVDLGRWWGWYWHLSVEKYLSPSSDIWQFSFSPAS